MSIFATGIVATAVDIKLRANPDIMGRIERAVAVAVGGAGGTPSGGGEEEAMGVGVVGAGKQ